MKTTTANPTATLVVELLLHDLSTAHIDLSGAFIEQKPVVVVYWLRVHVP